MRLSLISLFAVGLLWVPAAAQQPFPQAQPPAPPALDPAKNPLDWVLVEWEKSMTKVDSLAVECNRVTVDKVLQKKEEYQGVAKYLKTKFGSLGSLELHSKQRPGIFEKLICSGTYLYQYVPQEKVINAYSMPKPQNGQVADDNLLSLLFGMKATQAKQRYEFSQPTGDKHYIYVEIRPKFDADKTDFSRARLVLIKESFLPRQLWFEEPNGNEITWDFPRVSTEKLDTREFAQPAVPDGWRMNAVSKDAQPRIMRNQQ
jgi:TIGR03009 family protein